MTEPSLEFVDCPDAQGRHRMAYWQWGDAANPRVLLCAHGLSRQGRDFDALARVMAPEYRVVCPDVVGRGRSDWLVEPMGYIFPTYVADMFVLLAKLQPQLVHWVGTSMGGLIGLGVAAMPNSPVGRLVLNDVGPRIEPAAIARIGGYMGRASRWNSLDQAADDLWSISTGFGPHTRAQWLALTEPQLKPDGDSLVLRSDPAIALPFKSVTPDAAGAGEAMLWQAYDSLRCPTLVLRGAESDLLSRATAQAMTERGPRARLLEFAGVGHAPMLQQPDQIQAVREFLLSP